MVAIVLEDEVLVFVVEDRVGPTGDAQRRRSEGLPFVDLTTAVDILASRRVIEANGGVWVERFRRGTGRRASEELRFRIYL